MANQTDTTVDNEFEGLDLTDPRIKEIVEANKSTPEEQAEPKEENVEEPVSEAEENDTDDTKPESTEVDKPETEQKKVKSNNKISNREAKRLAYHNKQLQERLDALEEMIRGKQEAQQVAEKPKRSQFANDEDYLESMVLHKAQEIEIARQKEALEYQRRQQAYEVQAQSWNEKIINNFQTEQEQSEYADALANLGHPAEVLDERINNYIFKSPVGPKMIKYLSERPSVIPTLRSMHDWDLAASLQQIARYVSQSGKQSVQKQKPSNATPVGKLGAGKAGVSKSVDDMSDAELMAEYRAGRLKL